MLSRTSDQGAQTYPCGTYKLSGSWRRCWARPRGWRDSYLHSGPGAAKYSGTARSGKSIVSRIHCQGPNVSTQRDEPAANISPGSTVICRAEHSGSSCPENVTDRVKRYGVRVE